jgi:hypothetical protein
VLSVAIGGLLALEVLAGTACGVTGRPDPPPVRNPPLAVFSYESGLGDWGVQQPKGKNRITIVKSPGGASAPSDRSMRVEIRHGDVTDTGGYLANRSEVLARRTTRGTAPERWPDPVGSVRWYAIDLYLPKGFCTSPSASNWLVLTQWKGLNGGSPPMALEIKRGNLMLGGKHIHRPLGPLNTDRWTRLIVGMRLSPERGKGWVQVSRDGRRVVPRTSVATMDAYTKDGVKSPDPIYLKQGLYRSAAWKCTQVAYFGPTVIADKYAALPDAEPPKR